MKKSEKRNVPPGTKVMLSGFEDCQIGEYVWEDGRQRQFWDLRHPYEIIVAKDNPIDGWEESPSPYDPKLNTRVFEPKVLGVSTGETRPGYPRSKPERAWRRVK